MLRDRLLWIGACVVLASMAFSLWEQQAGVAALGAGGAAMYAAVAAVRGRCIGAACVLPRRSGTGGGDTFEEWGKVPRDAGNEIASTHVLHANAFKAREDIPRS